MKKQMTRTVVRKSDNTPALGLLIPSSSNSHLRKKELNVPLKGVEKRIEAGLE